MLAVSHYCTCMQQTAAHIDTEAARLTMKRHGAAFLSEKVSTSYVQK